MEICHWCCNSFQDLDFVCLLACGHAGHNACIEAAARPLRCAECGRSSWPWIRELFEDSEAMDWEPSPSPSPPRRATRSPSPPRRRIRSQSPSRRPTGPQRRAAEGCAGMDLQVLRKISRWLALPDWLAFWTCCSWYYSRPIRQFYRVATPAVAPDQQLEWVAARNSVAWMIWFLDNHRHLLSALGFSSVVADLGTRSREFPPAGAVARAMIDYDHSALENARTRFARLEIDDLRRYAANLRRSQSYRLPQCRALVERLGASWNYGFIHASADALLDQIERLLQNRKT